MLDKVPQGLLTPTSSILNPSLAINPSPSSGAVDGSSAVVDSSVLGVSSSVDSAAVESSPSVDCPSAAVEPASGALDCPAVELSPLSGALDSAAVIPSSSAVFWGVLGIGDGTIHHYNMASDFCYWTHIFTRSPGFDEHRSVFQALRSVQPFFPDGKGIFGDAGCEHLKYPLHPSLLHPSFEPDISAADFKSETLGTLYKLSPTMDRSETLVLLLICRGSTTDDGIYHLWVTGTGLCSEDSFTLKQLERAIEGCQARIVVVCNASQSARLASKHWTLICATGPTQNSDGLSAQSASENDIRGSMFTLCVTAQVAAAFGLKEPVPPRAEGRSLMESLSEPDALMSLPSPPPDHSSGPCTSQLPVYKPTAYFQLTSNSESAADLAWYDILPTEFTESMVHATAIHPDKMPRFKEPQRHGSETRIGIPSDSDARFRTLVRLAAAYVHLDTRYTQESQDSRLCAGLLRHVDDPGAHPSPVRGWEGDFCGVLRRRNVQAVAVQQIARGLEWWSGEITPFVQRPGRDYMRAREEMVGAGMAVDRIPEQLGRLFDGMNDLQEPSPIFWLVARWVGADRPRVTGEHWERVVEAAVDSTATSDALIW
ncbi:hypothetical protein GGX14DRAFT_663565 [Mycena pura]|uniref:Uncharacterized protein n=1 Tax=Mycena pura TaxID=153505 RepID=A0AAD6YKZ6_9AGAR|nr:hypothetical protein GGX14DRAFT_663565 [Mycena pura]